LSVWNGIARLFVTRTSRSKISINNFVIVSLKHAGNSLTALPSDRSQVITGETSPLHSTTRQSHWFRRYLSLTIASMERKTYSISVRLKRIKIEYAFVSVPLDGNVMEPDPEDATKLRVNGEKVFERAKRMGTEATVLWAQEGEPVIEIHPWQTAPPRA